MNPTLVKPGLFRDRREAGRVLAYPAEEQGKASAPVCAGCGDDGIA